MARLRPLSLFCALAAALLGAGPTTTQKAADADDPAAAHLRQAFIALADPHSALRQQARDTLMQIDVSELPLLQRIVEQSGELAPDQRAALHDIVCQVYMAGQHYEGNILCGFMGLTLNRAVFEGNPIGVEIVERIPGFCGYAAFHDGDIITALLSNQRIELLEPEEICDLVGRNCRAWQILVFDVLRQGAHVHILVRLMPNPELPLDSIRQMSETRMEEAQRYFDENFANPSIHHEPIEKRQPTTQPQQQPEPDVIDVSRPPARY